MRLWSTREVELTCEPFLQTNATTFTIGGNTWLVMVVDSSSDAINAVAANPGHPHIGLWLASEDPSPMIMAVIPSWFSDGSPVYFYIPGEASRVTTRMSRVSKQSARGSVLLTVHCWYGTMFVHHTDSA